MLFLKIQRHNLTATLDFYFGKSAIFKEGSLEFGARLGTKMCTLLIE
jgi:hypothetical protein